ncbi:hypothetical protein [Nostoc sp.]|uniref:hypothetical protein n=1 Tax=Nostoc sp. TaxID=1180 RepID=UPI002FFAD91C
MGEDFCYRTEFRSQESEYRKGILYDWWMNNRRFCTPTKQENLVVNFRSRGSESPTDSVTLSRVRVRAASRRERLDSDECILTSEFFFNYFPLGIFKFQVQSSN